MEAVQNLMTQYWINKDRDRELYTKTKREVNQMRHFFAEQLGWKLISNERILKLEKLPAHAESFMGITDFTEIRDYCMFCSLLIFLEDKEDGEQFLLSELVSMIEAQLQEYMEIDWTMFTHRKSLVRVLKFAEEKDMLYVFDGSSDSVAGGIAHEVLYENTGLSRYFATSFGYSIEDFSSYRDFEEEKIGKVETERGRVRTNRVYRQLAAAPAMYWDSAEDSDSLYLKNQRQWVSKYLGESMGGRLDIHKNAAFLVLDEQNSFGEYHPREATVSEIALNICAVVREKVEAQELHRDKRDCIQLSRQEFAALLASCQKKFGAGWSKEFREMQPEKLEKAVFDYMHSWMLLSEEENEVTLYPAVGKFTGEYPQEFLGKEAAKHV